MAAEEGLARTARSVSARAVDLGRARYADHPERLRAVISASTKKENALAVQGASDWIVISVALMTRLADVCERLTPELMTDTGLNNTGLGKRLTTLPPTNAEFTSATSSLLFAGALAFFLGHEIGHHLDGGLGIQEHASSDLARLPANDVEQALEIVADERGVIISRQVLATHLDDYLEFREYTDFEQAEFQVAIALLVSVSVFLCMAILRPRSFELDQMERMKHPPGALRVLWMSTHLTETVKSTMPLVSNQMRRHIRFVALDMAALASIEVGTAPDGVLKERVGKRNEPLGIRALSIRRALFEPNVAKRMRHLLTVRRDIRPLLRPR